MAEGHETPGTGPGGGPEGRPPIGDPDFLAERRARRAAESGEEALRRRAEAAEATVQTLERHVSSLQQRLGEAEEDRRRIAAQLEAEREHAGERASELREVKQREYAEQQLRVEAENRLLGMDQEGRLEVERLGGRLSAAESETRELNRRLEGLARLLAEAEQADATQRSALDRAEQALQVRVAELEHRAEEIEQGLHRERAQRERSDRSLESIREGHRRMEGILGELKGIVARLGAALTTPQREPPTPSPAPAPQGGSRRPSGEGRGVEMADALAAAVERLRARAELAPGPGQERPAEAISAPGQGAAAPSETTDRRAPEQPQPAHQPARAQGVAPESPGARPQAPEQSASRRPTHKHSRSLIARIRDRRKQRRTP